MARSFVLFAAAAAAATTAADAACTQRCSILDDRGHTCRQGPVLSSSGGTTSYGPVNETYCADVKAADGCKWCASVTGSASACLPVYLASDGITGECGTTTSYASGSIVVTTAGANTCAKFCWPRADEANKPTGVQLCEEGFELCAPEEPSGAAGPRGPAAVLAVVVATAMLAFAF